MFTMKIVDSDAFLEMPLSSQCLYFHLNMRADDDGFVGNPKKIMRMIQAKEDDLKILLAKRFLIMFEDNVVVVKHWWMHNTLAKDRYNETSYIDDKSQLYVKENKAYTLKPSLTDKPAIEKNKKVPLLEREPINDLEKVEKVYLDNYKQLYEQGIVKMEKPVINWVQSRKLTKDCIAKYGLQTIIEAVKKSKDNRFVVSKGYVLTTILSAGVLSQLINATDGRIDNDSQIGEIDF